MEKEEKMKATLAQDNNCTSCQTGIPPIPIIQIQCYHSPCGELLLGSFDGKLCLCDWAVNKPRNIVDTRLRRVLKATYKEETSDILQEARKQLDEYFNGQRRMFDIPLLFIGTDFQKKVWHKLLEIPYGSTLSYGELARQLGMPQAVRAVANANGANALSIFAPCHRIVGSNRSLTGYAGGLEAKKKLLDLERDKNNLLGAVSENI